MPLVKEHVIALVDYPNDFWTISDIEKARTKAVERILKFIFNE